MKTVIEILVLLIIIISLDFIVTCFLNNEYQFYDEKLNDLLLLIDNEEYDDAYECIDEIYERWTKSYNVWEVLADHSETEQIDILITKTYNSELDGDTEQVKSNIMELYRLIGFTTRRYRINIVNLL